MRGNCFPPLFLVIQYIFFLLAKLQAICDNSTQRLNALESEWAKVRDPLETELQAKERRKAVVCQYDIIDESTSNINPTRLNRDLTVLQI